VLGFVNGKRKPDPNARRAFAEIGTVDRENEALGGDGFLATAMNEPVSDPTYF